MIKAPKDKELSEAIFGDQKLPLVTDKGGEKNATDEPKGRLRPIQHFSHRGGGGHYVHYEHRSFSHEGLWHCIDDEKVSSPNMAQHTVQQSPLTFQSTRLWESMKVPLDKT